MAVSTGSAVGHVSGGSFQTILGLWNGVRAFGLCPGPEVPCFQQSPVAEGLEGQCAEGGWELFLPAPSVSLPSLSCVASPDISM